jgi:hypothetical protein
MSESILPSFFVPYVLVEVSDEKIKHVFEVSYEIGKVKFIDRVLKEDLHGNNYYSIYVFFESFNFDDRTIRLLEHSQMKEDPPRFYYNYGEPGYWKILLNVSERKYNAPSKKINLDVIKDIPQISVSPCLSRTIDNNKTIINKKELLFVPRSVLIRRLDKKE